MGTGFFPFRNDESQVVDFVSWTKNEHERGVHKMLLSWVMEPRRVFVLRCQQISSSIHVIKAL